MQKESGHVADRADRPGAQSAVIMTAVAGGGLLGYNTRPPSHKARANMAKKMTKSKAGSASAKSAARGKTVAKAKAKPVANTAKAKPAGKAKPAPAKKPLAAKKPVPGKAAKPAKPAKSAKPVVAKKAGKATKPAKVAKPAAKPAKPVAAKPASKAAKGKVQAKQVGSTSSPKVAPAPQSTSKNQKSVQETNSSAPVSSRASSGNKARAVRPEKQPEGATLLDGRYSLPTNVVIDLPKGYKPSVKEEYMNPKHLEYFRRKLQSWREDLVEESKQTIENLRDEVRDVGDEAERATRETENSLELRTRDRYRKLISKIDKALKRIEEGTYGFCEETDEDIGLDRLDARPIATLCLDAQERWEHRQKQMGD